MRKILVFVSTLMWVGYAAAQVGFEKYYRSGASYQFDLMELTNHNFIVGMGGAVLVDPQGNVLHNNYFWGDSILSLQSVSKYSDNEFYFITNYYGDTCYMQNGLAIRHFDPMIGKMDSLGYVVDICRYVLTEGCQNVAGSLQVIQDKAVITWGREWSFFALRTDSILTHSWSKYFDHHGGFQFIKELPSGDLLAGINMDSAGAVVARLDPDGNFLWCKSYIRPKGMVHDCVIESDDSFIIAGYTDSLASTNGFDPLPPEYDPKLFILKLNGSGDVQWCKGFDSTPSWYARRGLHIEKSSDGSYAVLANIGVEDHNLPDRPFLMKVDQNGDTLWTRSAGVDAYSHTTSDLLVCSDGGFLFDGTAYGDFWPGTSASYLFKTDSLGHLQCSEKQPPPLAVSDLFPTDSSFTLTSVDGAETLSEFVNDTVYGSITVLDGCTITSMINPLQVRKPRVYPNPNTGRFTVSFTDPLMAESYYSVYDAMGKLLFQRPLPTGATLEEIDLSRYGKGTYVIRFTDREGVCYERVVLE